MTEVKDNVSGFSSDREIANLMSAYAFLNDDADFDGLGTLFAAATFELDGTVAQGASEIATLARAIVQTRADGMSATAHEVTNLLIEVAETAGTASARAYWTVYRNVPGEPRDALLSGRYANRFERRDGKWLFVECKAFSTWRATQQ